jgi:hypothetical protein
MNNANLKEYLSQIFINSAELQEYEQQDGQRSKCLLVKIPFRSTPAFHKVSEKVVQHLEGKFNWPVIVVSTRTIISKRGKIISRESNGRPSLSYLFFRLNLNLRCLFSH